MYGTSKGERILLGGDRRLFEDSLAMMADHLSVCDGDFSVPAFDQLQLGQKLFALYRAGRALLLPDEPAPEITAFLEAAVAAVYQHVFDMVVQEIDEPDFAPQPSWRQLVVEAAGQSENIDRVPKETSRNKEEWEIIVDCLADDVIRDRDFELQVHLDADPDKSRDVKEMMGISEEYYATVAYDPPDDQLNLYFDALKGLTPRGRGESFEQDDISDPPAELF
ncbi:MAG: hypothetical protein O7G86_14095 [Gammaproteobacteria bacterium]|nr:hypothetical protein [Gammaproteobacteria bacterium]